MGLMKLRVHVCAARAYKFADRAGERAPAQRLNARRRCACTRARILTPRERVPWIACSTVIVGSLLSPRLKQITAEEEARGA